MSRPTVAEIDLRALENNWGVLTALQRPERLIPVIKADAYGHGAVEIAKALQKWRVPQVAVAMMEEAEVVRGSGYQGHILILGPIAESEIPVVSELRCTPVIGDKQELMSFQKAAFSGEVHVKWDTGMNRLGLVESDVDWLKGLLRRSPGLNIQAFCTHFLKADDFGQPFGLCESQLRRFQAIEAQFPEVEQKHIFNSDSLFANQEVKKLGSNYGARPGISLYGYAGYRSAWTEQLQPVMTLKTKIVHLVKVSTGGSVSYNATWIAKRNSVIAVLPIGYADGYPRSLSNKGHVFIRGKLVPLVGMVCMDYLMIDVTDVMGVELGDDVELWGRQVSLDELAEKANTITYELMTALTTRVPRKINT